MFMLTGALVSVSGVSRELFKAANSLIGHLRGGLGVATVLACGGFAAICGSSVATAATFSAVAYPEMRRFGYPQSFATGVIAAGGTLGAMLPPSTVLAVYGIITEQDIGKLFIAGIIPGILAMTMYMLTIALIGYARPDFLPRGTPLPWREALCRPEEHLGAGAAVHLRDRRALRPGIPAALHADRGRRRGRDRRVHPWRARRASWTGEDRGLAAAGHPHGRRGIHRADRRPPLRLFPDGDADTAEGHDFLTGLGFGPYGVLALIMLMYLVLGCLMDAMAMIILTVPIIFPVIVVARLRSDLVRRHHRDDGGARADPSAGRHERLRHQERGEGRDVLHDLQGRAALRGDHNLCLVILIAFPMLATWLPRGA